MGLFVTGYGTFAGALLPSDIPKENEEQAVVYVLRPKEALGYRQQLLLTSNQGHLFKMRHKTVERLEIPGDTFSLKVNFRLGQEDELILEVEPGKEYYLIVDMRPGAFIHKPAIVEVTAESFEREKSEL